MQQVGMVDTSIEKSIQDALIELLFEKTVAEISVAELARRASIARGTFYKRFPSVREAFRQLVRETVDSSRTVGEQLVCIRCGAESERPEFCELTQTDGRYRAIMHEPTFLATMHDLDDHRARRHFAQLAERIGLTPEQEQAVFMFQSSGCYSLAASSLPQSENWNDAREAVDCFIAGGFAALTAQYGTQAEPSSL